MHCISVPFVLQVIFCGKIYLFFYCISDTKLVCWSISYVIYLGEKQNKTSVACHFPFTEVALKIMPPIFFPR